MNKVARCRPLMQYIVDELNRRYRKLKNHRMRNICFDKSKVIYSQIQSVRSINTVGSVQPISFAPPTLREDRMLGTGKRSRNRRSEATLLAREAWPIFWKQYTVISCHAFIPRDILKAPFPSPTFRTTHPSTGSRRTVQRTRLSCRAYIKTIPLPHKSHRTCNTAVEPVVCSEPTARLAASHPGKAMLL